VQIKKIQVEVEVIFDGDYCSESCPFFDNSDEFEPFCRLFQTKVRGGKRALICKEYTKGGERC